MSGYHLNKSVYELTRRDDRRTLIADKKGFFASYDLSTEEMSAVLQPNFSALSTLGLLSNLLFRYYMLHGLAASGFRQRLLDEAESIETAQSREQ